MNIQTEPLSLPHKPGHFDLVLRGSGSGCSELVSATQRVARQFANREPLSLPRQGLREPLSLPSLAGDISPPREAVKAVLN